MRKKILKMIEATLPRVFDEEGEVYNKKALANTILDKLPNPERLGLTPFEMYIPHECSGCTTYNGYLKGCLYELFSETYHEEHPAPANCPNDY